MEITLSLIAFLGLIASWMMLPGTTAEQGVAEATVVPAGSVPAPSTSKA